MTNWSKDVIDRAEAAMLLRRDEERLAVIRMIQRDKARQRRKQISTMAVGIGLTTMAALLLQLWRIS
jgi:hypothetical protein